MGDGKILRCCVGHTAVAREDQQIFAKIGDYIEFSVYLGNHTTGGHANLGHYKRIDCEFVGREGQILVVPGINRGDGELRIIISPTVSKQLSPKWTGFNIILRQEVSIYSDDIAGIRDILRPLQTQMGSVPS